MVCNVLKVSVPGERYPEKIHLDAFYEKVVIGIYVYHRVAPSTFVCFENY